MALTESRIDARPAPGHRPGPSGVRDHIGAAACPAPMVKRLIPTSREGAAHGRVHP